MTHALKSILNGIRNWMRAGIWMPFALVLYSTVATLLGLTVIGFDRDDFGWRCLYGLGMLSIVIAVGIFPVMGADGEWARLRFVAGTKVRLALTILSGLTPFIFVTRQSEVPYALLVGIMYALTTLLSLWLWHSSYSWYLAYQKLASK